ncbi:MAG TPA: hypothetical protein VNV87_14120 [Acidimicrobiales bacterium]|jgi:hypothetical protein|nr:hypothetical protein [Acidimicrobiales bacterium]
MSTKKPTEVLILTDDFLPLSVREAAKNAAIAIVEAWRACETYDQWAVMRDGLKPQDCSGG